jgi:hypothetical protein
LARLFILRGCNRRDKLKQFETNYGSFIYVRKGLRGKKFFACEMIERIYNYPILVGVVGLSGD